MAHLATKRYSYAGQGGILLAFTGAGLVVGALASLLPLLGKISLSGMKGFSTIELMDKLLVPENANAIRWSQFISTLLIFFVPPVLYAWLCHVKPFTHLGFKQTLKWKQAVVIILIMLACLPIVGALQEFTEMFPWSKETLAKFKAAEEEYNRQVAVIARMNNFADYLITLLVIALLPAVFEETLFRGAMQNLLSRWLKKPVLAIIIVSIIFSAIHGSYLGFLSRFLLSVVLGWMYYRTGNIWLNILAHFLNNAVAATMLYLTAKPGQNIDPSKMEEHFPWYLATAGLASAIGLFIYFEKLTRKDIDRPGEEVLMPDYRLSSNPFEQDTANSHTEASQ